jgi:radical SAM protein with 4Fe4S-binding SPASM domain
MRPLRAERVFPKFGEILDTFPGKVVVSVPVSKLNISELPSIRESFLERGAVDVIFAGLISRCAEDRTTFDALALGPHPIRCPPLILDNLIVDCDGEVLLCCNDFQRKVGIGNLSTDDFDEVLNGVERVRVKNILREGRHEELKTCSICYGDTPGVSFDC